MMQSRRDFLKSSVLSTLSLPFANALPKTKIVILGGGIAGLSAAHYLRKRSVVAPIYEAQSRVGGRIMTANNLLADGITTELGGEFIDSTHTDLLNLCKEFHLPLLDMESASEKRLVKQDFFFGGSRISEKQIIDELKNYSSTLVDDCSKVQGNDERRTLELDNLSLEEYLGKIGVKGWLYEMLKTCFTSELGLDAGVQGCIIMLRMLTVNFSQQKFEIYGNSDERYKISGGNERVINALSKRLVNQVRTDYVLERIIQSGNSYKLDFQNGRQVKADVIINTLPFTALRNVKLGFEMSEKKRKCINELDYGTQSKLFLGFKSKFWRKDGFSGYLLNDHLHNGWDSSQMQKNNIGSGGYSLFLGGEKGKNLLTSEYEIYLKALETVYPGAIQNFNGRYNAYNWSQNPFAGGAYSCYKVGQATSIGGLEGQSVGNIYFAGEHCSEEYGGFMNGAVETARKVVQTILKKS